MANCAKKASRGLFILALILYGSSFALPDGRSALQSAGVHSARLECLATSPDPTAYDAGHRFHGGA
jgi:hypothetical protein